MKATGIIVGIVILFSILAMASFASAATVRASPSIEILPDKILNPNEQILVIGKNWTPNGTVRIDLILPSGTAIEGVVSGKVNATGSFQVTFTAPNTYGEGYVKAIEGDLIVSVQVFFNGNSGSGDLLITWSPQPVYTNQTTEFSVQADFLSDKNYVLDVIVFHEAYETIYYEVLHNGISVVDIEFKEAGLYYLTFKVEGTIYNKTVQVQVFWNPNGGGDDNGGDIPQYNATFTVVPSKDGTTATVTIIRDDGGFLSGRLTVITPSGTTQIVTVVNGMATIKLDTVGTYLLQFKDNASGKVFSYSYDFSPSIMLDVSPFDDDAKTTIVIKINGEVYDGDAQIMVMKPDGTQQMITYMNGQALFYADESGIYTFSANVLGKTVQATMEFEDSPELKDVVAMQTPDGDYLIISGYVYGEHTKKPLSGVTVRMSSWDLSHDYGSATTDDSGRFVMRIPLTASDRGKAVSITLSAGKGATQTLTVTTQTKLGDYMGWWIGGGILLLILLIIVLEKLGYIHIFKGRRTSGAPNRMFSYR